MHRSGCLITEGRDIMKPADLAVYDTYPELTDMLVKLCAALQQLPLDEMLTANERIMATGALVSPDSPQSVDVEAGNAQHWLIQQAITFRDSIAEGAPLA